jgi:hypothetical protein
VFGASSSTEYFETRDFTSHNDVIGLNSIGGVLEEESAVLLKRFFLQKRNEKDNTALR